MKKILIIIICLVVFTGCSTKTTAIGNPDSNQKYNKITYQEIDESFVILDVREYNEYDEGHIPGAILMPVNTISEINYDKDTKIVVYCKSGNRSKVAYDQLVKMGYNNVYDLGSISNYTEELKK